MGLHTREVGPARPIAAYIGGKKQLAKTLINFIDKEKHEIYCEPFVGMGGVFLRRSRAPKVEAINDLNRDVAIFFRVLQRHYQAFMDMLKWQVTSRAEFERLAAQNPDSLTDLERAARFLYLQRLSFGGKVASRSFGADMSSPARFNITRLVPLLEAAHERLAGVWIECLPWQEFIERWDRPGTLFYLDPPYFGTEHFYGREVFRRGDFDTLATRLRKIKGKFIISINDVAEIRRMFRWARMESVGVTYTAGGGTKAKKVRELIIRSPARR